MCMCLLRAEIFSNETSYQVQYLHETLVNNQSMTGTASDTFILISDKNFQKLYFVRRCHYGVQKEYYS